MSGPTTGADHAPRRYEIRLAGHLEPRWAAWFDGMTLVTEAGGTTLVHGPVADQAALHGLLRAVRDAGLPLVSVTEVGPGQVGPGTPASRPPDPDPAHPHVEKEK